MRELRPPDEKPWAVDRERRSYGLRVVLPKRTYVLPWAQFLLAEHLAYVIVLNATRGRNALTPPSSDLVVDPSLTAIAMINLVEPRFETIGNIRAISRLA
jgi:hypothetical protein